MVLIGCLCWGFIGLGFSIWDTKCEFIPFADSPELPMFSLSCDQRSWVDALNENHFRPKFPLAVSKNPFKGLDNWAGFVPWTLLTFANMPRVGNQDDDEKIGCHGKDKLKVHHHYNRHHHHYHQPLRLPQLKTAGGGGTFVFIKSSLLPITFDAVVTGMAPGK